MFEQNKNKNRSASITRIADIYQHHPSMLQVQRLKNSLKQEKLQDRVFYQQIKHKIASR